MIKSLIVWLNLSAVLFFNFLFQTPVQINVNAPSTVNAGESFEVTVTLSKGELSSFSRYLQQIPYGLTATAASTANADFSFKDQKVRLIWLRLPEDETVTFIYKIHVDQRLKGDFNLEGLFSYIENNERKSVSSQSPAISIIPSPDISPDMIVDINEFEGAVIQNLTPDNRTDVMCYRQVPKISDTGDGLIVNIIVDKGTQEKFAKIEETIPSGYDVIVLDDKEAIFSYKDNIVKFLWMNLPSDTYFNISYKLIPIDGTLDNGVNINGLFSYIEDNDKTVSVPIVQEDFELTDNSFNEIKTIFERLANKGSTDIVPPDNLTTDVTTAPDLIQTQEKPPSLIEPKEEKPVKQTKKYTSRKSDLLTPEKGVYYRIQIAAGHKQINIRQYFKKFNLEKSVKKESHEGWYKYSVGSFKLYKEARDYRNYIWRTTIIDDAFVSAYNEGNRITVQEALMIANQRWYK